MADASVRRFKVFWFLKPRLTGRPVLNPFGRPAESSGSRSPPVKANGFGFRARTLAAGPSGICPGDFSGSRSPPMKANEFGFRARTLAAGPPSSRPARRAPGLQMPHFGTFSRAKSPFCSKRHIPFPEYGTKEEPTGGRIKRTKQRRLNRKTDGTCGDSTGRLTGRATD